MTSTLNQSTVLGTSDDPSSPLHYPAEATALLLLDFQNFVIALCGSGGKGATTKAALMREWALTNNILVLHSLVDVNGTVQALVKGRQRIIGMLSGLGPEGGTEPSELAYLAPNDRKENDWARREYVVRKPPGTVSGLESRGAIELLIEHGIESLIICGLSTSGAVLRTAVPATDGGYVVSVIRDVCADPRESLHELLMEHVLPSRAHVVDAAEFIEAWDQTRKRRG